LKIYECSLTHMHFTFQTKAIIMQEAVEDPNNGTYLVQV
jgi:hypothetical protein